MDHLPTPNLTADPVEPECRFRRTLQAPWTAMPPVRVGAPLQTEALPDAFVTVRTETHAALRIDLYGGHIRPECFAFEEALVWHGWVAIGFGEQVHLVSLADHRLHSHYLGSYFGSFHAGNDYLLAASAERLFRVGQTGELVWTTLPLGLDGVLVHGVEAGVITGSGEWDPPGGWKPFNVDLSTGQVLVDPLPRR